MNQKKNAVPESDDALSTRRVQEILERNFKIGLAIDSNHYINGGGGTLATPFRSRLVAADGRFVHLAPSVWVREIKKHIAARVEGAKEKISGLSERDVAVLHSAAAMAAVKELKSVAASISGETVAQSLWDDFAAEAKVIVVDPPSDSAQKVLDWYFERRLPFEGAGDKKHEFPDAFALYALDQYALANGMKVVVVTKDKGAYGHCVGADGLLPFRDIESALGAFDAKGLIDKRRYISEEASKAMLAKGFDGLVDEIVGWINRPYEHGMGCWVAATKPSFPQTPRILVDEVVGYEVIPAGNFGQLVSVVSINDGEPGYYDHTLRLMLKIQIRAFVSCEVSAIDTRGGGGFRQKFPLDGPVSSEFAVEFLSVYPFVDGDPVAAAWGTKKMFSHNGLTLDVEPIAVQIPDYLEYRGFA